MGLPADDGSRAETPTVEDDTPSNENDKSEDVDMGYIGCLTPQVDEVASELILMAIGSTGRSYRRETRAACRRIVSDI